MFTAKTKLAIAKGILTKKSPIYVQYAVTGECNLSCRMCRSNESRRNQKNLTLPEIEKLADTLSRLRVGIIVLTGGEPFLRDDLPEIIDIFTRKGFTLRLQTNGILAGEKQIKEAVRAGLREVTLSLDFLSADRQEQVQGKNDSWQQRIEAIVRFSNLLPKEGTVLGINSVVSRYNIDELASLITFASRIGFYSSLIPVHVSADNGNFVIRKNSADFKFEAEAYRKIDEVFDRIITMKKRGFNIYNSLRFLSEIPDYLKYGKIHWECKSPDLYFAVSPSGNFQPCIDIDTPVSMLDGDFVKRFYSAELRGYVKEKTMNCRGCFYACWPEITYLCYDFSVFLERFALGKKMSLAKRKPLNLEECLSLIKKINEGCLN